MKQVNPKISIVFPCYNGEKYIKENLGSIKNLSNIDEIELVIVDNNSNDTSKHIIRSFNNINLKLLEQDQNLGFAEACNIGVEYSNGKYIFITNQDVVFPKDFFIILHNIYKKLDKNNNTILCPAVVFNNDKINYFGAKIHFLGFSYTSNMYQIIPKEKLTFKTLKISGCGMFLKKEYFTNLNGFDNYFFMYHEDTDFSLRALRTNMISYATNETVLLHKKDHFELSDFTYFYIERNRYICLIKNMENLKKLIPFLIISELMLLVQAFLRKKLKSRIKVYKFLIQRRKELIALRFRTSNCTTPKLKIYQLSKHLDPIILGHIPSTIKILRFILKSLNIIM